MNLLIVDDKPARYDALIRRLRENQFAEGRIDLATSIGDALERLEDRRYEILVVDMMLPQASWGAELSDGGAQLLQHIEEGGHRLPTYIVGITAASEDSAGVKDVFDQGPWILLRDSPGAPDWERRLEALISHAVTVEQAELAQNYDLDICLVTALKSEYAAVLRALGALSDPKLIDSSTYVQEGKLVSQGKNLTLAVACASRMGATEAALLCSKLLHRFRPRLIVMAGICAGFEEKTQFGDVLVGSPVWDYMQSSKIIVDEAGTKKTEYAPDYILVDPDIAAHFEQLSEDTTFLSSVHQAWPADKPHGVPRIRVKPVATGPAVIADGQTIKEIRATQHRDTFGLEMEAYGLYCAARNARRPRPLFFSAKAVCDFGNYLKNDKYQAYAAYCSSAVVLEFLRRYGRGLTDAV